MRILIFTEPFLPPAYLPRVRYFCHYFVEQGWEVHLVAESSDLAKHLPEKVSVFNVDYYKLKSNKLAKIEWGIKFLFNFLWDYKGRYFYKKSKKLWQNHQYDAIFASTCFTFPLTVAMRVAKELDIPFFADLRDIMEQSPDDNYYMAHRAPKIFGNLITKTYKKVNACRRNNVLKKADGVITVSPWHVKTLSEYSSKVHLIYNGFDDNLFIPKVEKTDKFTISYFGRIFNIGLRNPELLFEAVKQLHEKTIISSENTVVKWYVDDNSKNIIKEIEEKYGLSKYNEYYGFIKPTKLSEEANKSSVYLIVNNNKTTKRYFGIMTTKFYEGVGTNRPILCVPDSQEHLSELIRETNCGIASSDVLEIEEFLKQQFEQWKEKGYTVGKLDEETRLSFSRRTGAKKLENIILDSIKKRQNNNTL